ncbi:hypothetical protein HPB51_028997 [Rhipicephalus microplus]|uniref:Uncharacterized protein n=1 Tax=Rhipicephalus microplus TaxID=6941 RepID=A0A9J6CVH4_RHIMP|nr:hypothetical protein HPB51_029097 [Rhipicephalus microplus]KAH7934634.1 hypothetical protein HPB51_028997 [Rhipicephalus microplus]
MPTLWHSGPSSRYLPSPAARPLNTSAFRAASSAAVATRLELPVVLDGSGSRSSRDPHADLSREQWGRGGTNRLRLPRLAPRKDQPPSRISQEDQHRALHQCKVWDPLEPPVLVKDFPP